MMPCFIKRILFLILLCAMSAAHARLNLRGQTSFMSVASGAHLVINQPITGFNGTLTKNSGANLTGQNITFSNGILQDTDNQLVMTAIFGPSGTVTLSGNQNFLAQKGTVLQSVSITGTGNQIIGRPIFAQPITLQNSSAALAFAIDNALTTSVILNSGSVTLNSDLSAADNVQFVGPGTINLNGKRLSLGGRNLAWPSNITWQSASDIALNSALSLSGVWTFTGSSRINGNGNIIDVSSGGSLSVASGGTLYLNNMMVRGLGSGGGSLTTQDTTGQIHLSNVTLELVGALTTSQGQFYIDGPTTVVMQNYTWTFTTNALLTINGVTLWTDPVNAMPDGAFSFGSPQSNYLTLNNNGRIKDIGILGLLQTSTGYLQTQVTANSNLISELQTSTGYLQNLITTFSLVELINEALQSSTVLQSLIEEVILSDTDLTGIKTQVDLNTLDIAVLQNVTSALQTSTGYLQTQVTANATTISLLQTSTGYLQTQITTNNSLLQTSTGYLQSQIITNNSLLETSTGYLQSQITANASLISLLQTSTGYLQAQITTNNSLLETSTGYLQSQITANANMISLLQTSTGYLQTQETANATAISLLRTSTGYLQTQITTNNSLLETSTGFLQTQVTANTTDISLLRTSTGYLQSQITANANLASLLQTSTGYLQTQVTANTTDISLLRTSTGYLQTQINSNAALASLLQTSTGLLQTEIDGNSALIVLLETSTGYLQQQIDNTASGVISALQTSTGYLQTQINTNNNLLQTSTGYLQAQINANDVDIAALQLLTMQLQTSTGELYEDLIIAASSLTMLVNDILLSSTILQSIIEAVILSDTDLTGMKNQVDLNTVNITQLQVLSSALQTSTGYLQAQINSDVALVSLLQTSTGLLQTEIDGNSALIVLLETSTGYLQQQIDNTAAGVISALQTSTGYLQTQITINNSLLQTSTGYLQAQINDNAALISLLATSTGYLQTEIDGNSALIVLLETSTGYLQSEISTQGLIISELQTSTGMLQIEIDTTQSLVDILYDNLFDCCFAQLSTQTGMPDKVKTVDWAHSDSLLVVGLDNSALIPTSIQQQVLRSYAFNGGALTLLSTYSFAEYREVQVVRYHPTQNLIAVGRIDAGGGPGLTIFAVDPITGAFTLKASAEIFQDVFAVAWHPDGDRLAVGRNISGAQIAIYSVAMDGSLTGPIVTADTDREVEPKALEWNNTGQYLAAGINVNSIFGALQIWNFNKIGSTLTLNVGIDVPSTRGNPATNSTVLSVAWNKVTPTLVTAGLAHVGAGTLVQTFEHNGTAASLAYVSGISDIGNDVNALSWNSDDSCLSIGTNSNAGGELRTYMYSGQTQRYYQVSAFEFGSTAVEDVRFSSDALYLASGADNSNTSVYSMNCRFLPRLDIVESRLDALDTQITEIATSTGYLQAQVNVSDVVISVLQTSTGYLQVQIDSIMSNTADESLDSRVDILEQEFTSLAATVLGLENTVAGLQSIVESCCDVIVPPIGDTTILVSTQLCVTPTMLPTVPGFTVEFKFTNSSAQAIFDPLCLGSYVNFPQQSGIIFSGQGQAVFKGDMTMHFDNSATCSTVNPHLGLIAATGDAEITLDTNATLTISGDVEISLVDYGYLTMDKPSTLMLGAGNDDVIQLSANSNGIVAVNDPDARITFNRACYDVLFNHNSALTIDSGLVEFNSNNQSYFVAPGVPAAGILRNFQFTENSTLNISPAGGGVLLWGQNRSDAPMNFNTVGSIIPTGGLIQYREFNGSGVQTLYLNLKIQGNDQNKVSATNTMVNLYVTMCRLPGNTGFNYAAILVAHNLPLPPSVFGLPPSGIAALCMNASGKPNGNLFILPIGAFKVINKPGSGLVTYSVGVDTITKPC